MKKFIIFFFSMMCALYSRDITFSKLQISALEHSHRLKLRGIDTSIEEARLESIYSALYPQLSLVYSGEYNHNLDSQSSGSISVGDTTINSAVAYEHSVALRLNYELYHFGSTLKQIEVGKKEIAIKRLEQCNEEEKLYREILDHYARAQKAQSEQTYKSQMKILRQELYTLKQRLFDAGKESRVSIGDEAIRIIDLERDIENSRMEYEENIIALSKLSHIDLSSSEITLLPLESQTDLQLFSFFQTVQAHSYEEKILQKNSEIEMLQRNQLPAISFYSSYYLYGSDMDNFHTGFNDIRPNSWNAGVNLRWSLFEGFKYNSESKRLHYELHRVKEEYDLAKREFEYKTRSKQERLSRLSILTKNETQALDETHAKLTMTKRLRAHGETDAVSEVSVKLEGLERELTLNTQKIQQAYESESLKLQHRGVEECTPR